MADNPEKKLNYLQKADLLIHGARNKAYGHPLDNHTRTAQMWSAYLSVVITPEQVCDLNILQKLSRNASGVMHPDNDVDIAGYVGNKEMVRDEMKSRMEQQLSSVTPEPARTPIMRPRVVVDAGDLLRSPQLDWSEPSATPKS